jgi:hypothetical protein
LSRSRHPHRAPADPDPARLAANEFNATAKVEAAELRAAAENEAAELRANAKRETDVAAPDLDRTPERADLPGR